MLDPAEQRKRRQRAVQSNSLTQRIVDAIRADQPETGAQIAKRLGIPSSVVNNLLYQRANTRGGIYKVGKVWHIGEPSQGMAGGMPVAEARAALASFKRAPAQDVRIAQVRAARPFVELTAATISSGRMAIAGAPAMRPGADDHKRIPSLYGDYRVPYKGLNSIRPTTRDSTVSGLK